MLEELYILSGFLSLDGVCVVCGKGVSYGLGMCRIVGLV